MLQDSSSRRCFLKVLAQGSALEVTLGSAGDITVNADQTVPATTRVAVT